MGDGGGRGLLWKVEFLGQMRLYSSLYGEGKEKKEEKKTQISIEIDRYMKR